MKFFDVYKFQVITQFIEPALFPTYKGSTLRGAFGVTFKNIVCVNKKIPDCEKCIISSKCVYKQIFEPDIFKEDKTLDIPSPFVLEPPYDKKTEYKKGDSFEFQCVVVDKAVDYFPYFVITFKEIGKRGLGIKGNRGRFKLLKMKNSHRIIYDEKTDTLKDFKKPVNLIIPKIKDDMITLKFISPIRIKIGSKLISDIPFSLFLKVLLRRISLLNKYYCEEKTIIMNYNELLEKANFISTVRSNLQWYDWERFSSRQKQVMRLGGFTGTITYKGNLKEFLPFIKLGEIIHIGKNTSFGLGKYIIK
ncbi:MAG: CRISPR system precrRNA processing endoribonuclease RAMP protein Cas6 [Candidatus Omnitrophica bacterium]|nr:CRISPR system precrRNA processing endoribonuclease RAMP protein Cas6 [Candidatus Omnitrophota bacterium]